MIVKKNSYRNHQHWQTVNANYSLTIDLNILGNNNFL